MASSPVLPAGCPSAARPRSGCSARGGATAARAPPARAAWAGATALATPRRSAPSASSAPRSGHGTSHRVRPARPGGARAAARPRAAPAGTATAGAARVAGGHPASARRCGAVGGAGIAGCYRAGQARSRPVCPPPAAGTRGGVGAAGAGGTGAGPPGGRGHCRARQTGPERREPGGVPRAPLGRRAPPPGVVPEGGVGLARGHPPGAAGAPGRDVAARALGAQPAPAGGRLPPRPRLPLAPRPAAMLAQRVGPLLSSSPPSVSTPTSVTPRDTVGLGEASIPPHPVRRTNRAAV